MKLEVDYIKAFEEERKELEALCKNPEPPAPEEKAKLDLMIELAAAKEEQYERKIDEELKAIWVEEFYPLFCEFAQFQGGRATLEINEESLVGTLTYYGHDLIINDVCCTNLSDFTLLNLLAEDVNIAVKDGLLEIKVIFHIYEKVKVKDNTDKFEAILKKATDYRQEQRLRNLLYGDDEE